MAPTGDKAAQSVSQPFIQQGHHHIHHQNHRHHHNHCHESSHTKENNIKLGSSSGSVEILDFHESWLKEMKLYKDIHNNPNYPKLANLQAQLLTAHNNQRELTGTNNNKKPRKSGRTSRNNSVRAKSEIRSVPTAKESQSPVKNTRVDTPKKPITINDAIPQVIPPKEPALPNKIIVNQFHASSLLNSQQLEDKSKILCQNGLTKTAATAFDTSMFAANYLKNATPRTTSNGPVSTNTNANTNNTSPRKTNISDNKRILDATVAFGDYLNPKALDVPNAAIDDVDDFTDSDSEEEYTGCPFYLPEDGEETRQSQHIRGAQPEAMSITFSSDDLKSESQASSIYSTPESILSPSLFPNVPPYINFSNHKEKGPNLPTGLHKVLKWKFSPIMPKIVKRVVLNSGFRIIRNTTDWMAIWERHMRSKSFRTIRSHQKYNHMPGSFRIGRKDSMWRNIHHNMKKFGKREFGFMQRSYIMPEDLESLRQSWPKNASKLTKWIVKPPASARGTGIRVVNKWSQFPKDVPLVVQKYIEKPLLINDNKFDMRLYVLVTSVNPLRIYLYKDGLARFAAVKYNAELTNLEERCMHLTNYSINKFSRNYAKNTDFNACSGHKWTLQSLWSCLEERGVNTKRLWAALRNLVIRAIISGESGLNRMYRQNVNFRYNCYEMFGFDVLLDENLIPWLLEINISPSLHSELPLDLHVKGPLIQAMFNTCLYQVPPKLTKQQQDYISDDMDLQGPLCMDKRIFTTCLTAEEIRKHNKYCSRHIEYREDYLNAILKNLSPDDVRCLIIAEDELARCGPLERIFPTPNTYIFLKFIENPRYYNRLLDAWENRYGSCREKGRELLTTLCESNYHLQVPEETLDKEPIVERTDIDKMYDNPNTNTTTGVKLNKPDDVPTSKSLDSPEPQTTVVDNINTTNIIINSNTINEKDIIEVREPQSSNSNSSDTLDN